MSRKATSPGLRRGFSFGAGSLSLTQALFLLLALALTTAIYWPGLSGPLILDDRHNLAEVFNYASGKTSFWAAVTTNESGPLGRPLTMLTFALNARFTGDSIFAMKLTNLVLHLGCGLLLFSLVRTLTRRDERLADLGPILALGVAAAWLTSPLLSSTVLYTIQRMAQLSTFFMLAGLWSYALGRQALAENRQTPALTFLFLAFPICLGLACLSKENGALLPLLAGLTELTLFQRQSLPRRSKRLLLTHFSVFLFIPAALALTALAVRPERFFGDYVNRDFTFLERLLTQPRVLWSYMGGLLMPSGASLGVFQDDYVLSRSLLSPWTTLLAICAWMSVIAGSILLTVRGYGFVACGLAIYLGGHALESSIFPLEIYFEHRNYLPAAGLFIAIGAAATYLALAIKPRVRLTASVGAIVLVMFSFATFGRAHVWSSYPLLLAQAAQAHPDSPRVNTTLASLLARRGELELALHHLNKAEQLQPHNVAAHALIRPGLHCLAGEPIPEQTWQSVRNAHDARMTAATMAVFRSVVQTVEKGDCPEGTAPQLVAAMDTWVAYRQGRAEPHGTERTRVWLLQLFQGRLYAHLNRLDEAANLVASAHRLRPERIDVAIYLAQLQAASGQLSAATHTITDALGRLGSSPDAARKRLALAELSDLVRELTQSPASAARLSN